MTLSSDRRQPSCRWMACKWSTRTSSSSFVQGGAADGGKRGVGGTDGTTPTPTHNYVHTHKMNIQWDLSIEDTSGTQLAVLYREVSHFRGRV